MDSTTSTTVSPSSALSQIDAVLSSNNGAGHNLAAHFFWREVPTSSHFHFVQFYETDDFLLDSLRTFIGIGLGAGDACIIIATKAHCEGLAARLQANSLHLATAREQDQYIELDAEELLAQFLVDGEPDPARFNEIMENIIARAARGQRHVRIFGEIVALLWAEQKQATAIRLEELWNNLVRTTPAFSLLCAYPTSLFGQQEDGNQLLQMCQQHASVIPDESYTTLVSSDERLRAVILWQQKAHALEDEITKRNAAEARLREQVRLAALHMEVSIALTVGGTMQASLERCARALVQHLDAAFARFWTLNEAEQMLELRASAGMYTHLDGGHARVPVGSLKIGLIAKERKPHLTNAVIGDPRVTDQEWATREGMVAFAGYPLLVGDRLVGVMALFARHQITETALAAMASVANAMAVGIQRYQTEKEQVVARQKVEESEERFRTLADNMSQFAWTADPTGWIFWYNQRWYDYTGTTLEQMAGWGWQSVQHPEHVQQVTEKIRACFETGEIWEDTFPLRGKDGTYRWFLSRAIPIRDTQGKILRWFGTNTDITEQKDLEHQKEVFVSMATHELKTPLTSLRGYIQLAERQLLRLQRELDSSQPEQQKALDGALLMLSRSQQQLSVQNRLINDMLDISRIQASALELLLAPCDLGSLVRETVQDYQIAHPQRQITLNQPEQEVLLIHADQDRIVQVLSNYLNNALKYSVAGTSINVNIMCKHAEARICVTDQGPGLSPEAQQHIWEQFYRAPGIEVQNNAGASLGLGLSICQGIISSHHGQVGVESTLGHGSRFWFTLPLLPEEA